MFYISCKLWCIGNNQRVAAYNGVCLICCISPETTCCDLVGFLFGGSRGFGLGLFFALAGGSSDFQRWQLIVDEWQPNKVLFHPETDTFVMFICVRQHAHGV